MPTPKKTHAWRDWRKAPPPVKSAAPPAEELPQVDLDSLTPRYDAERDAAAFDAICAARPLKPPGRA